jgi:hypothetical protein
VEPLRSEDDDLDNSAKAEDLDCDGKPLRQAGLSCTFRQILSVAMASHLVAECPDKISRTLLRPEEN